ncbi:MAG TPA: CHAP domain-containing protein [Rhizomicrobium sp.]
MSDNAAGGVRTSIGMYLNRKAGAQLLSYVKWMILPLGAMLVAVAPLMAHASVPHHRVPTVSAEELARQLDASVQVAISAPGTMDQLAELAVTDIPTLPSAALPQLPEPSIETPLKRLFCVEYARARSGLAVFGDAKFWWTRAKNLYARATRPVENAVMVFSGSKRLKKGHVAVVTDIISKREIRVDQANWQNHGEIDHSTPVLDVSARNDWTKVRVWDMRSNGFGAHVYGISGFIAKELVRQAAND